MDFSTMFYCEVCFKECKRVNAVKIPTFECTNFCSVNCANLFYLRRNCTHLEQLEGILCGIIQKKEGYKLEYVSAHNRLVSITKVRFCPFCGVELK